MLIEAGSPCSLPLGLIRTHDHQTGVLGVTLQHPSTDVFAEALTEFSVTGPMAHKGYAQARHFFAHHRRAPRANYALIRGASASVALRHHLSQHVGIYGGVVMAAITENEGARHTLREMRPIE